MSAWQPIETAPMDGTWVLTFDSLRAKMHRDDIEETMAIAHVNGNGNWIIMLNGMRINPTHWMPLPEPPK